MNKQFNKSKVFRHPLLLVLSVLAVASILFFSSGLASRAQAAFHPLVWFRGKIKIRGGVRIR